MSKDPRTGNTGSLRSGNRGGTNSPPPSTPSNVSPSGRLRAPLSSQSIDTTGERRIPPNVSNAPRTPTPAEFNTAMAHFYRGEVQRANTWRNRLDTTTNWAVLTAAGTLSFAFSAAGNPHFVILINSVLVAFFLHMEARRYRYYEIWSSRVRVLETGYFAQMLAPGNAPDEEWADHLAADLLTPHFTISMSEAIGRRLRRNYLWIFLLLAASWNLKVYLHPVPARHLSEFIDRATIGLVPGWFVVCVGVVFNAAVITFAIATVRLREATGEVLPRHEFSLHPLRRVTNWTRAATTSSRRATTLRRAKRARQRVRTTSGLSTNTGEFKRPNKVGQETISEEILTRQ